MDHAYVLKNKTNDNITNNRFVLILCRHCLCVWFRALDWPCWVFCSFRRWGRLKSVARTCVERAQRQRGQAKTAAAAAALAAAVATARPIARPWCCCWSSSCSWWLSFHRASSTCWAAFCQRPASSTRSTWLSATCWTFSRSSTTESTSSCTARWANSSATRSSACFIWTSSVFTARDADAASHRFHLSISKTDSRSPCRPRSSEAGINMYWSLRLRRPSTVTDRDNRSHGVFVVRLSTQAHYIIVEKRKKGALCVYMLTATAQLRDCSKWKGPSMHAPFPHNL